MTRAAIYARFSSDKQDDRSIDDQVALCRAHATRQGWTVVEAYPDYAISGASVHGRFALERMVGDARAGRFDVILAEDLDRLSRNQADIAALYERMTFVNVALHTVADGAITEMHIGLKGTMSALFLKTLALKTHRGLQGRIREGRSAGGRSYGYRVTETGLRTIEAAEAAIVLRIFSETIRGDAPRAIAARLNAEGVPSPRGGAWNASTINGSKSRGTGILRNRLYVGEIVWNRQRFVRDPDTGKRVSRVNAGDAVMRTAVPELRIVSEADWAAVQARLAEKSTTPASQCRQPKHLLSGLLRCGKCGGSYVVAGGNSKEGARFGCSSRRERATCDNARFVYAHTIEERILGALETHLLHEDVIAEAVAEYIAARRRRDADRRRAKADVEKKLGALRRRSKRILDLVADGHPPPDALRELREIEQEEYRLEAERDAKPGPAIALHPGTAERYRTMIRDLRAKLKGGAGATAAIAAVRSLIDRIVIYPRDDARGDIELHGNLAALLQPEKLKEGRKSMVSVVAGARFTRSHTAGPTMIIAA